MQTLGTGRGLCRWTYLGVFRRLLAFAVLDGRVTLSRGRRQTTHRGYVKREGQQLTRDEIDALARPCTGGYADVVPVLALDRLRRGELAGPRRRV